MVGLIHLAMSLEREEEIKMACMMYSIRRNCIKKKIHTRSGNPWPCLIEVENYLRRRKQTQTGFEESIHSETYLSFSSDTL